MKITTKLMFPLLCSALIVAGCAQAFAAKPADTPIADTQTTAIELKKNDDKTKLVVVTNGDAKTFNWSAADFADPEAMEKALAEVPEAQREKIKQLLTNIKDGKALPLSADGVTVHRLGPDADGANLLADKQLFIHKLAAGDGSEFSLLKSLLSNAKLDKPQLQELQKLLDAKY